jgi:hypothetical protein
MSAAMSWTIPGRAREFRRSALSVVITRQPALGMDKFSFFAAGMIDVR